MAQNWRSLENALGPRWKPWLDWYGRRLDGIESSQEKELLFATLPVDPREKDPTEQNAALAAEIERLGQSGPREGSEGELKFETKDELEAWLETQPREVSVVIAARAALRVLPTRYRQAGRLEARGFSQLIFVEFWTVALARFEAKYPGRVDATTALNAVYIANDTAGVTEPATNAVTAVYSGDELDAASHAADAAANASYLAAATARADANSGTTATTAADAAHVAASDLWAAVSADANRLKIVSPSDLAGEALWPRDGPPKWVSKSWRGLQDALTESHWEPWLHWYGRQLDGVEAPEAKERLFGTLPDDPREKDPAEQNAALAAEIERLTVSGTSESSDISPPALPSPGPGPKVTVVDEKFDAVVRRQEEEGPQGRRSEILLGELREAIRDFVNSFDVRTNAHGQLRKVATRYQSEVDLETPSVDLLFALGLRLENAVRAAHRNILSRCEPTLEDGQEEALTSVLEIHAVFIAADPEGQSLLEAAARYPYNPSEDEAFRSRAAPVAAAVGKAPDFAAERLTELLEQLVQQMGQGEHPERSGLMGRNTVQTVLITVAKTAILGATGAIAGQIAIHMQAGQYVIANSAAISDKAIAFLLNYQAELRALAASYPEGFGFVARVIDWLKGKLGV